MVTGGITGPEKNGRPEGPNARMTIARTNSCMKISARVMKMDDTAGKRRTMGKWAT